MGLLWSWQDGVGPRCPGAFAMHTRVPTASRGWTVGSHRECFMWHKTNQGLSRLMKSISPFLGCSKTGIQPFLHIL